MGKHRWSLVSLAIVGVVGALMAQGCDESDTIGLCEAEALVLDRMDDRCPGAALEEGDPPAETVEERAATEAFREGCALGVIDGPLRDRMDRTVEAGFYDLRLFVIVVTGGGHECR